MSDTGSKSKAEKGAFTEAETRFILSYFKNTKAAAGDTDWETIQGDLGYKTQKSLKEFFRLLKIKHGLNVPKAEKAAGGKEDAGTPKKRKAPAAKAKATKKKAAEVEEDEDDIAESASPSKKARVDDEDDEA